MKKHFKYLFSLSLSAVVMLTGATSCTPDDHELSAPVVSSDELVEGIAFSVIPDASDPNTIHLKSLVKGATPVWKTPNGLSQNAEFDLQFPFAGDYELTFGVMTKAGTVWGEPYVIKVTSNNFAMLSDPIWTNLAGGVDENGQGNPKKWVPCNNNYGIGGCSAPVMYMSPDDYPDPVFGYGNWLPNWDPGFQSWLIPADDPYMDSYMTFSLDPVKGCVVEMMRKSDSGEEKITGNFNLNASDPKHPMITFLNGAYSLHNVAMDGTCSNYTNDIRIIECTPYLLQVATMRTNDEGPWWLVWNFISEDLKNDPSILPSEGPDLVETYPVVEPEYADLATDLFTISGDNASYIATQTTFLLDEETPYDLMWWNPAAGAWEWINGYGSSWAPAYDAAGDFALTLNKNGKMELENAEGGASTTFTIEGNKIVFADEVTLLSSGNVAVKGKEFMVMKCSADDNEVVFGIPVEKDATGAVNKYLCAKMTIKPISGGQTGPTVLKVNNDNIPANDLFYLNDNKYIRVMLYNPWAGKDDSAFAIDPTMLKLKKNQTIKVKFTITGIDWTSTPKAVICAQNANTYGWDAAAYSASPFVKDLNTSGETELTFTNETGSTYNFYGNDAIEISIDMDGTASSTDLTNAVVNITSVTIE